MASLPLRIFPANKHLSKKYRLNADWVDSNRSLLEKKICRVCAPYKVLAAWIVTLQAIDQPITNQFRIDTQSYSFQFDRNNLVTFWLLCSVSFGALDWARCVQLVCCIRLFRSNFSLSIDVEKSWFKITLAEMMRTLGMQSWSGSAARPVSRLTIWRLQRPFTW